MNLGGSVKINKCGMLIVTLMLLVIFYYFSFQSSTAHRPSTIPFAKNPNEINLRKLLIAAIQAAQHGGDEVLSISKRLDIHEHSKGKTAEGANDPITEADSRSHCVMQHGLQSIFPKLRIVSEEGAVSCEDINTVPFALDPNVLHDIVMPMPDRMAHVDDVTVWIDPLDATKEYTEKLFQFVTTMVCVAVRGKPVIGVIHNPFTQRTSWAWNEHEKCMSSDLLKKYNNDLLQRKDSHVVPKDPIVIVSRSHTGNVPDVTREIFGEQSHIIPAGGAGWCHYSYAYILLFIAALFPLGYKVLEVVFDNATAYMHTTNIKKWDICAGNAILLAMGGRMSDFSNEDIDYRDGKSALHEAKLLATMHNHNYFVDKIINKYKNS